MIMSDEVRARAEEMAEAVSASDDGLVEKVEEGTAATRSSDQKQKLCHWKECRGLIFMLLVSGLLVALAVGLALGLLTWNDDAPSNANELAAAGGGIESSGSTAKTPREEGWSNDGIPPNLPLPWIGGEEDDAGTTPASSSSTPAVANRSCEYELSETVLVRAPRYAPIGDVAVEKKLSGGASALDGDNAVIISYNGDGTQGAVWALSRSDDDGGGASWEQTGVLQTDAEDQLGWGAAMRGDTFVVGAPGHEGREIWLIEGSYWAGRGMAVVMSKNEGEDEEMGGFGAGGSDRVKSAPSSWYQQAILSPEVADDNAHFGASVAIAECECLIAVGAWHDRDSHGSVYVFAKNDDGRWTEIQKLAPDTRRSQSDHLHGNYGYTVAITNGRLAVKAPYDSYKDSYDWKDENRGVVYVYERGADGTFARAERLYTPEGTQVRTHLKDMLFLDNFLLVGAPGKNRVYVFERIGSDEGEGDGENSVRYRKTAELAPSDGADPVRYFGVSLDGKGNEVLVGEHGNKASYLFSYEDGAWKENAKFDGFNAALSGGTIVEHAPVTFGMMDGGEQYGGEVNFYDLACEI